MKISTWKEEQLLKILEMKPIYINKFCSNDSLGAALIRTDIFLIKIRLLAEIEIRSDLYLETISNRIEKHELLGNEKIASNLRTHWVKMFYYFLGEKNTVLEICKL